MNEPKRARRRRDLMRMTKKARRLYSTNPSAGKWADHLAVCSCWMCGNPRRRSRAITLHEVRWLSEPVNGDELSLLPYEEGKE